VVLASAADSAAGGVGRDAFAGWFSVQRTARDHRDRRALDSAGGSAAGKMGAPLSRGPVIMPAFPRVAEWPRSSARRARVDGTVAGGIRRQAPSVTSVE
jgi:hypothetical protein